MNNRALTMSLVMGAIAILFVSSYVTSIEDEAKKKYGTEITVVVAREDIKEMETITEKKLMLTRIPKKYLEPAAVSFEKKEDDKEEDKDDKSSNKIMKLLAGTIAVVPIKKGEQISYNKITEPSMRTGLAPQIAPGRRAMAISVNELSGVSKLVKPGDRVDLITVVDFGGKEAKMAKTLLQDVVVLSIGRYITNNAPRVVEADTVGGQQKIKSLVEDFTFASVTLEVEPLQAEILALVQSSGDNFFMLSLRNNDDVDRVNVPSLLISDVYGADANRAKAAAPKK